MSRIKAMADRDNRCLRFVRERMTEFKHEGKETRSASVRERMTETYVKSDR